MSKPTGLFFNKKDQSFYQFLLLDQKISMKKISGKRSPIYFLMDENYPIWILRHSLGKDMGPEDYSHLTEADYLTEKRSKVLGLHQRSGSIRDLFFHGINVPCNDNSYSHAVGPIHAGIIEPGHFRFVVEGEMIHHLTIRLGFQNRDLQASIHQSDTKKIMHISEAISGDSSISYALVFSKIFEEAARIKISKSVSLFRSILVEIERIAIHIGDLGGLSEDIGYYPLYGVCVTDRGAALGLMENWTGNRFGKGAIRPGGVRVNRRISVKDAMLAFESLKKTFVKNIEPQIERALVDSTIKERLQGCGPITKDEIKKNGFVGQTARCAGELIDLRIADDNYPNWKSLPIEEDQVNYSGDAWARFYLRYNEIKQSLDWINRTLPEINWDDLWSDEQNNKTNKTYPLQAGIYYNTVESWRGPILVSLLIDELGKVTDSYIRDPSVLNWHALELAVRGELIGDFPLNNKSFNLSYAGFDL